MSTAKVAVANCKITIHHDHVTKNPDDVENILERVSKIISGSYKRRVCEGECS